MSSFNVTMTGGVVSMVHPTYRYSPSQGGIVHKTEGLILESEIEQLRKGLASFGRNAELDDLERAIGTMIDFRSR